MNNRYSLGTVFLFLLMISPTMSSQDRFPKRGPGAERIEQFKKIRLMEVLKMDDETSIRFFTHYNKYEERLRAIQNEHNTLIDQLQELSSSNANNSDLARAIKDIGISEEKIAETRSKFLEELKGVISIKQIAEYVVFERNFNKNLREIMRDIARERWNREK